MRHTSLLRQATATMIPHTLNIECIPYQSDSHQLFDVIHQQPNAVFLDSGHYPSEGRCCDIISAFPSTTYVYRDGLLTVNDQTTPVNVSQVIQQLQNEVDSFTSFDADRYDYLPFIGGLIFQSSYEFGLALADIDTNPSPDHLAVFTGGIYHWAVINDHIAQKTYLVSQGQQGYEKLQRYKALYFSTSDAASPDVAAFKLQTPFAATITEAQYADAFDKIKHYIVAGDCYQVNYSQHFSADYQGSSWQAYQALTKALPSPFSAYFNTGQHQVLSISPERFIEVRGSHIQTKPIKGTRPRGKTPPEDMALAQELKKSSKDRAENLMIVDLLRNDLSMSARCGTVKVPALFALESFANVHHLVSTIQAELDDDANHLSLLTKALPGGSITGAPKKRAMEIITELETVGRSAYCGTIAYISSHRQTDSNIAIRTVVADGQKMHCWGGGGIVMDSICDDEYRESMTKVSLIMETLERSL